MSAERPLRADAARNRSKILDAADRQIVAHGPEVRMESIAEEAGVAVGTLYRHFPTKDALVAAVVESHVERIMSEVEATADRMEAGADALEEFRHFFLSTVELAASDKAAKAAARALGAQLDIERPIERGIAAMERIIKAGKQSGHLRADLSVDDFYLLFATVPVEQPPKARERWMELVLNGIAAVSVTRASETG
ncbi:TetR/AcrR family transcriptional regulator [Glycomyces sp. YM15]|uniref:TetR/AcrR family transcriptional regulator n=1 Tax=Glycomyces sp. YM15 TaxID=2800446 RepID=UPI001962610C|nr:TetR/AcrR family transcriptional regulator [Glycomyces sp. YM15]